MTFPFTTRRDTPPPPSRPTRFYKSANVVLDANGYGYCTVYVPSGVMWNVTLVSVSTSVLLNGQIVQPTCFIYQDSQPRSNAFIESTYNGDRASSNSTYELLGGEAITAEWRDGQLPEHAGAIATLAVRGTQIQV